MTSQLAARHPTDSMDKVATVEILKPVLVWVMSIGMMIELMGRGILDTIFITSVLEEWLGHVEQGTTRTYTILFLVEHKGSNGPTGVGVIAGLTTNTNSGMTNAKVVNGTRNSARRGRH